MPADRATAAWQWFLRWLRLAPAAWRRAQLREWWRIAIKDIRTSR